MWEIKIFSLITVLPKRWEIEIESVLFGKLLLFEVYPSSQHLSLDMQKILCHSSLVILDN